MNRFTSLFLIALWALTAQASAQHIAIHCSVYSRKTDSPLAGASIEVNKHRATLTDEEGYAELLEITPGRIDLSVRYVGYLVYRIQFKATRDTSIAIPLIPFVQELAEVTVTAQQPQPISLAGQISFSQRALQMLPSIGGEHDVNRNLTLLPGVKLANEGHAGLYVRGGSSDQNLYSIQQVPIYKYSHFFGFLSPLNSDVIQQVDLYKSGFPARFGGRLSSVVDVTLRSPSLDQPKIEGSLGILSSRLLIEVPLIKNRLAIMLAARRSYFDIFTRFFQGSGTTDGPHYTFYDLNASINARLSKTTQLNLSAYRGQDRLDAGAFNKLENLQFDQRWLSNLAGGRLVSQFSARLSNILEANLSNYELSQLTNQQQQTITTKNHFSNVIKTLTLRNTVELITSPTHTLRMGGQAVRYWVEPGNLTFSGIGQSMNVSLDSTRLLEYTGFIEAELRGKYLQGNAGMRLSQYGFSDQTYGVVEPRLRVSHRIDSLSQIHFSYDRTNQVLQLMSNTGFGPPVELWFPPSQVVRPQSAHQLAVGYSQSIPLRFHSFLSFSVDGYWKTMKNILSYRDGFSAQDFTTFAQNNTRSWENLVTSGQGQAYGLEFQIQKKTGRLTGWVGYTLSWVRHKFADLNQGMPFFAQHDRRHDGTLSLVYQLSKRWQVSGNWLIQSGQPMTLPVAVYSSPQVNFVTGHFENYYPNLVIYSERNQYRMRATHRFDLSFQRKTTHRWGIGVLDLSIYNLYNRQNPYYYYLAMGNQLKAVSLFSFIPSLSYQFQLYLGNRSSNTL